MMRPFDYYFSQSRRLRERKEKNLHPISEMHRFYILVCCCFCSVTVSVIYAFDLFAEQFQSQFHLSAGDLSTISTVGLVFCYFTIPYSFIFENLGPFMIFWICFVAALIGGLCLGLVFDGKIQGNTATISVFYAFLNMASGLIDTAYISTLFEIFPRNRGPVVCLAKVMTGLGSSVLSTMSATLFEGNISGFIYFVMALCMTVSLWASFVIVLPPYFMNWWRRRGKTEEQIKELEATVVYYERKTVPYRRLVVGYVVVIALLIFFTVSSPVLAYTKNVSHSSKLAVGSIAIVLTMSIFLMLLPIKWLGGMDEAAPVTDKLGDPREWALSEVTDNSLPHLEAELDTPVEPTAAPQSSDAPAGTVEEESRQDPRYEGTFLSYLCSIDLWLIMLLFVCYGCIGILVMYNASTISVASTGEARSQQLSSLYTAFLGVGSSVGRIAFGLFEAFVQSQDPDNRRFIITMAIPISPILACLAGILILVLPGNAILFPYILVYLEEGVFAGVNALIFPCLFESHHNALYNLSFLVQCITTICFNRLMFGLSVDRQHDRLGLPSSQDCNEKVCVRMPIIVGTCLAFVGIFVAFAIHIRYSRFVRRVRAARMAEKQSGAAGGACDAEMDVALLRGPQQTSSEPMEA